MHALFDLSIGLKPQSSDIFVCEQKVFFYLIKYNAVMKIITKRLFLNTFPDSHLFYRLGRYDTFITQTIMNLQ